MVAVRKKRVKDWVKKLHGGTMKAPEDLVWEVGARAEVAKARGGVKTMLLSTSTAADAMKE